MITFYDLASTFVGTGKNFSPNPGKTRIELNYRGLPYTTIYLEYPDIAKTCISIGAAPTSTKDDGTPHYTLPVIHDSSTGKSISDSNEISLYLEETYPATPRLFPSVPAPSGQGVLDTKPAAALFEATFMSSIAVHSMPIMLPMCNAVLNPYSEVYFRSTREKRFGSKLEDVSPPGSQKRKEDWAKVVEGLEKMAAIFANSDKDKNFFLGDVFSRADLVAIAFLSWIETYVSKEEWDALKTVSGGRWVRLVENTKQWQIVKD